MTPWLPARSKASSCAGVGRPAPVAAQTMPLAPAATQASIMAPSALAWDNTTSTRGSASSPLTSNSVAVVCGMTVRW